ncbi:MAG: class I SAM-dependent methyltransferase [Elusimicrobia bacterium]|nr:class I SAM-dependent methyltransferase [Elusimicrobiota bacterium]
MTTDFEAFKDDYKETLDRSTAFVGQDGDFFAKRKADLLLDLAGRRLGPPAGLKVLDLGSGLGLTDRFLSPRMPGLCGVDVAPGVVAAAAKANPGAAYRVYDGRTLPYPDGGFDLVFTVCVAHHVPPARRGEFFAEMRRVTRRGGLNVVFEHNPYNPLTRHVVNNCPFDADAVLLEPRESRARLSGAGLTPVEQRYFLFFPWEGRLTARLEAGLGWLPLGAQYFVAARL